MINHSDNGLHPCDSWLLRRLRALDSQFCKGAVMRGAFINN